ncbi:hypothetical protein NLG97_g2111 [Lecanicillium saksenae]|uniref:Uncharacterized protein n=1 Tax=Lecanicillium saksenae TaxID=468837 RepID=A0ACC1R2G3_9HYPO|nr:hypothetical protein NLG97_g2111 [Lecanicillium saksenae]
MLQASAFLMVADSKFNANPQTTIQVGPDFVVSVFMVFRGYSYEPLKQSDDCRSSQGPRAHKIRKPSWQEVLHKARLSLHRQPISGTRKQKDEILDASEYSYCLEIKEEKDDGRLHDDDESTEERSSADHILITEVTKLLYTNSAAILNIKDDLEAYSTPILLLKRRVRETHRCNSPEDAGTPEFSSSDDATQRLIDCQILDDCHHETICARNNISRRSHVHKSQFPSYLDPEWIAFQMYTADASDEPKWDQSEAESEASDSDAETSTNPIDELDDAAKQFSSLMIGKGSDCTGKERVNGTNALPTRSSDTEVVNGGASSNLVNMVTTSLSLLELVLRLAIAQETQQMSHLSIPDHILTSFLNERAQPSNTGNGA